MKRSETTIISNTKISWTLHALIFRFYMAVLEFIPLKIWGIDKNGPVFEFIIKHFSWNI